jgi:hypothetical protein
MSANDTQVGGTHYRAHGKEIQHWDLAVMYQWDPFQYQITKYVMRWKYKHATPEERLKDLQKAAHFLQKYIESAAQYQPAPPVAAATPATKPPNADWLVEGYFGDNTQEYKCRHCGTTVRAASADAADDEHGACPRGRGYVYQD